MNHTKGKWEVAPDYDHTRVTNDKGEIIAYISKIGFKYAGDEIQANAKLISKAPEMLELLKEVNRAQKLKGQQSTFNVANWHSGAFNSEKSPSLYNRIESLLKELEQ